MAAQTKKFNARTATKVEFDRELKRIASAKCIALGKIRAAEAAGEPVAEEIQAKYNNAVAAYEKVAAQKAKRFPGRKTYMTMTAEEIQQLNLNDTMAGIASLACRRSRYPHKAKETQAQEALFQAHKAELSEKAEYERLAAKYAEK